jgi:hypothetical protein
VIRFMTERPTADDSPELLTLPTAARRAGVGLRQLWRARHRGELSVYLIGGWPRVRWTDVLAWIERQRDGKRPAERSRNG